jgi:hypothetical protein
MIDTARLVKVSSVGVGTVSLYPQIWQLFLR